MIEKVDESVRKYVQSQGAALASTLPEKIFRRSIGQKSRRSLPLPQFTQWQADGLIATKRPKNPNLLTSFRTEIERYSQLPIDIQAADRARSHCFFFGDPDVPK